MGDDLPDLLASLYYEPGSARILLTRIGFPAGRIPAFNTPLVFWSYVVSDLQNGAISDGVARLLELAQRDYPANEKLQALRRPTTAQPTRAAAPSRDTKAAALPADWIVQVYQAAVDAGLYNDRAAVLSALPARIAASLPSGGNTPAATLLRDLNHLNMVADQGDAEPLLTWLKTAYLLSVSQRKSAAVFAEARALVEGYVEASLTAPASSATKAESVDLAALRRFLPAAFTAQELQMLVEDFFPTLARSINWAASLAAISFDTVNLIARHGVIPDFIDRLRAERPLRAGEIDAIAKGR